MGFSDFEARSFLHKSIGWKGSKWQTMTTNTKPSGAQFTAFDDVRKTRDARMLRCLNLRFNIKQHF